jgi:hypothetical protein
MANMAKKINRISVSKKAWPLKLKRGENDISYSGESATGGGVMRSSVSINNSSSAKTGSLWRESQQHRKQRYAGSASAEKRWRSFMPSGGSAISAMAAGENESWLSMAARRRNGYRRSNKQNAKIQQRRLAERAQRQNKRSWRRRASLRALARGGMRKRHGSSDWRNHRYGMESEEKHRK